MYRVDHVLTLTNLETGEKSEQIVSWEAPSLDMIQKMSSTTVIENVPDLLTQAILEPTFKSRKPAIPAKTKASKKKKPAPPKDKAENKPNAETEAQPKA